MRSELTFYLVADLGKPLSMRYQAAVERLRRAFLSGFPKPSDPAEISNAVEETARRVARYETQRGEVEILLPFLLKTYLNVVRSMIRGGYYGYREAATPDCELEFLAGSAAEAVGRDIEKTVLVRQVLGKLDKRRRGMIWLSAQGFTAKEIASVLGLSQRNVNTCLHRAREVARKSVSVPKRCNDCAAQLSTWRISLPS